MNNNQHRLSRKFIFKFENGAFTIALVYICFNNQSVGLIMIDKRRRDDTQLFVLCGPGIMITATLVVLISAL